MDELEALKLVLADMSADDLGSEETGAMAAEISAIRLQLKRLAFEQAAAKRHLLDSRRSV